MTKDTNSSVWIPAIRKSDGPLYLAIADALAADVSSGVLREGSRLPTQRRLANSLGIDFTTVTRAYTEAQRRGLVEGRVGLGTYIKAQPGQPTHAAATGLIDLSTNWPPHFRDQKLIARLWQGIASLNAPGGLDLLLNYQETGGAMPDRAAGAHWLSRKFPSLAAEHVLVCPGAQGALFAIAGQLASPGEAICAGTMTYPGFRSLAAHQGWRLIPVAMDDDGLIPDAFDKACRQHHPKALYTTPTLHNPTTATMPVSRREVIAAIAREHHVPIIEDDAYGMLPRQSTPPLAAFAPELTFYISSLAKCLSPALRVAYVVPPDSRAATRLAGAVRATMSMTSPLTASIATRWIQDGTAEAVLAAIRTEMNERQEVARAVLPPDMIRAHPEGLHLWLRLPAPWTRGAFMNQLHANGISVTSSDVFALEAPPEAVRLSLGRANSLAELRRALETIATLLSEQPAISAMMV
jgi:DNA-binding transcriptional MocR family regulator